MSASPMPPELAIDVEPFTLEQLDTIADLLAAGVPVDDVVDRVDPLAIEPWRIDDAYLAEWAMRHVADVDAESELIERQHREWREKIERWHDTAMERLRHRRQFFVEHLTRYALAERERSQGKVKSLSLPSGTVRTTQGASRLTVDDEAAVVSWARAVLSDEDRDAIVRVVESPRVNELRKRVEVVEVVDELRVVLHCGCIIDPWVPREGSLPGLGDGVVCPSCGSDALVGQIDVLESHQEARDSWGDPVPGVVVVAGQLSATVSPT